VLNSEGRVVAINAGGKMGTAAAFYLPLPRVARALSLIQAGLPVPRGTVRLGLGRIVALYCRSSTSYQMR
jgi:hypothetical protein